MKKLLVILLLVCMVMMSAVPAFAVSGDVLTTQATPDELPPAVSSDPAIVEAYNIVLSVRTAIDNADYQGMVDALEKLGKLIENFSDAQIEEWNEVVENNMGLEEYLDIMIDAIAIETVKLYMDEYLADPNFETAYYFVDSYDSAIEEGYPVSQMIDGAEQAYQKALSDMPAEKIVKIYEAYEAVADAVWGPWVEDFDSAIAGFEAVLDDFNALTEEELEQLAVLMGAESGEEAFSWVLSDWINLNICDTMVKYYEDYKANPNKDTAATFVDYYDVIKDGDDEELKDLVYWCFDEDFDSVYAEANVLLGRTASGSTAPDESKPQPQQGADSEKTDESIKVNKAPVNTDGTTNAVIVLFAMLILATGLGIFVKKAK